MNIKDTHFKNYRQLLQRVDAKFAEIQSKYPASFSCKNGCFGCCRSGLTVTHVEGEHIRVWLEEHPEVKEGHKALPAMDSESTDFCRFLNADGGCTIYEVRPIVCRSHGAPILVPSEDEDMTLDADVCPLNFQDQSLETLDSGDWIRLDTLNTILSAVDREFDQENSGKRVPLDPTTFVTE